MKHLLVFLIVYGQCTIGNVFALSNKLNIWNDLDPNHKHTTLFVHCKSGSIDKGPQYVPYGKLYQFPIKETWLRNTLFWCTFRHGPNYKFEQKFDVYKSRAQKVPQGSIYEWTAKEDGIYFRINSAPMHKVHNWKLTT
ncbi:PREDICTED: pumilio homolog 15-like [Camelina sativa]|uniref:S-protein homolog n=1 Tax=Camelina sativa TaxID=90675 RepID=A0ABM0VR32_CAMSA|nr:PREDICTED: pumilio homolog 15-like [Camelina sativa]